MMNLTTMIKWFKDNYKGIIFGVVIIFPIIVLSMVLYGYLTRPTSDTTVAVETLPAKVIKKAKKRTTKVASVQTYEPETKANLRLPKLVIDNPDQQVTGATTIAPSERKVTVTSVLDTTTGETTQFAKPEPLPWFSPESRGEVRFDYGYKMSRGQPVPVPVGRLSLTHNFLQVKGIHAGVNAALDTDGVAFAGVGIGYRW